MARRSFYRSCPICEASCGLRIDADPETREVHLDRGQRRGSDQPRPRLPQGDGAPGRVRGSGSAAATGSPDACRGLRGDRLGRGVRPGGRRHPARAGRTRQRRARHLHRQPERVRRRLDALQPLRDGLARLAAPVLGGDDGSLPEALYVSRAVREGLDPADPGHRSLRLLPLSGRESDRLAGQPDGGTGDPEAVARDPGAGRPGRRRRSAPNRDCRRWRTNTSSCAPGT